MAGSGSHTLSVDQGFYGKALAVIRSFFFQKTVFHRMVSTFLHHLLQYGLAVIKNSLIFQIIEDKFQNKCLGRFKTTIQIHGSNKGFQRIGYDGVTFPATHHFLASSKKNKLRKAEFSCAVGKALFAYHAGTLFSKFSLLVVAEFFVQKVTADQFQHCVTQEFQTLVAAKFSKMFLIGIGAVCHCLFQQRFCGKLISDGLFQFF